MCAFFGRGKNTVVNPYTFVEMYKFYLKDVDYNPVYKVEYNEYVDIAGDYLKLVMDYILLDGGIYDMGFRLGECSVIKKDYGLGNISKQTVDWKLTNKLGKKIIHLNEHSRGHRYGFYWNKKSRFLTNIKLYRLVFTRANKRLLAKLIKSGTQDYYEKH